MLLPTFRLPAAVLFSAVFCTAVLPVHAQQDDPPLEIPPSRTQTNVPPAVVLDLFRAVPAAYAASPDLFREPDTAAAEPFPGLYLRRRAVRFRPSVLEAFEEADTSFFFNPPGPRDPVRDPYPGVRLDFFSGRPVRHDRGDRHDGYSGGIVLTGVLAPPASGTASLSTSGPVVVGSVDSDRGSFRFGPEFNPDLAARTHPRWGIHSVVQIDPSRQPPPGPTMPIPGFTPGVPPPR